MRLLTGATGVAGSFVVNEFVQRREPVRILVRNRAKAAALEKVPTVEIVEGDMSRRNTLGPALDGVDRVLMISAPSMDMVETQSTFVDAAKAAGVRHVIKFSGLDSRPETAFLFGRMHKEIEEYVERSGLTWTHFRPTGFMQEYLREAPSVINEGAFFFALDDVKLNPVDLADVAKVGFLLLRDGGHEGARLPMTGPEALSMADVADRVSRATGRRVRYVPISRNDRRQTLMAHGIPPEFAEALDKQVEERLKGGAESRVDLSTHQLFNVKPTTFLEFAQRNAEAFGGRPARVAGRSEPVSLKDKTIVVTGGSRGLGLGLVQALVDQGAKVTVVARGQAALAAVEQRLGVAVIMADITDEGAAQRILAEVHPDILVLNAGATPPMGRLDHMSWADFTTPWETDVKGGLYWMQAALNVPLAPGARVLVTSMGGARTGSPLSGGYAGAKHTLWLMAKYANAVAEQKGLGIRFQVVAPLQMIAGTGVGDAGSGAYAKSMGIEREVFLARFGVSMPPRQYGDHLVAILDDPQYTAGLAFGLKGDTGITVLEGEAA